MVMCIAIPLLYAFIKKFKTTVHSEMDSVHKRLVEWDEISCITSDEQFSVVSLNRDVLYTALVMIKQTGVTLCGFLCQTGSYTNKGNQEFNP